MRYFNNKKVNEDIKNRNAMRMLWAREINDKSGKLFKKAEKLRGLSASMISSIRKLKEKDIVVDTKSLGSTDDILTRFDSKLDKID